MIKWRTRWRDPEAGFTEYLYVQHVTWNNWLSFRDPDIYDTSLLKEALTRIYPEGGDMEKMWEPISLVIELVEELELHLSRLDAHLKEVATTARQEVVEQWLEAMTKSDLGPGSE